jgi:hypothetical protein
MKDTIRRLRPLPLPGPTYSMPGLTSRDDIAAVAP